MQFLLTSKVFDTLSHAQIIENHSSYGVCNIEKDLFINYLFNRKQAIGDELSEPQNVTYGVPQILGPLLFLLIFNDVESVLHYSKIVTYADDTVIYLLGRTTQDMTEDFQSLVGWL